MLQGKTAIVTGGNRGIGKSIAIKLASQGAFVALLYAGNHEAAKRTEIEITESGGQARGFLCDVTSFEETKKTIQDVLSLRQHIDILVNNAGITKDGLLLTMSEDSFDAVIDTNLKGAFHMIRHLYSPMMKQRSGRIINMASVAGLMGNPGQANYASAKAGLIGLTKTVAKELAGRGVTCNAIAPGFIDTDMTRSLSEKVKGQALEQIPLKRMGEASEVAELVAFLASDKAAYITGEVIRIDGGLCM